MKFLKHLQENPSSRIALVGDIGMYLMATILGFLSHAGETGPSLRRVAATFLPFSIAWLIVAPWLGAYDPHRLSKSDSVWRSAVGALIAAPLGAFGRSLWLNTPILPLFVIIMGAVTSGLIALWRLLLTRILADSSI